MTPLYLLLKVLRIQPTTLEPAAATFSMWIEKVLSLESSTPKSLRWSFSSIVFPSGSLYWFGGLAVLPGLCPPVNGFQIILLGSGWPCTWSPWCHQHSWRLLTQERPLLLCRRCVGERVWVPTLYPVGHQEYLGRGWKAFHLQLLLASSA